MCSARSTSVITSCVARRKGPMDRGVSCLKNRFEAFALDPRDVAELFEFIEILGEGTLVGGFRNHDLLDQRAYTHRREARQVVPKSDVDLFQQLLNEVVFA